MHEWWKGALFIKFTLDHFRILGNGIGDLKGIIQRLDYISNLE